jgi:proline dehydrogenase
MENLGKPVTDKRLETMKNTIKESWAAGEVPSFDFQNTEVAFAMKTDEELHKAAWLFGLMNKHWLVGIGSKIGIAAIKLHLPFVEQVVKSTIFQQFCGGTTLLECTKTIERLYEYNVQTILDYGAEAKETEEDFNATMNETIRAIEFAAQNQSTPVVSSKISGLARFGLLESLQAGEPLTRKTKAEYRNVVKRIDSMCHIASQKGVSIFFDAEESWIQDTIDHLVNMMMKRYNKERAVVYNTYQLYRTDRLQYLMDSYDRAQEDGYILGAKLVRGAYMEKERERAHRMGYPSPIQPNKEACDDAYDMAVRFCVERYETIALANATHNAASNRLQAELIAQRGIQKDHPHLNFCQLYGMSDNITFNLAKAGYNVAKYVPYGPVREVIPYLIRRAQENTSVTGDMTREHKLVIEERKRRGIG